MLDKRGMLVNTHSHLLIEIHLVPTKLEARLTFFTFFSYVNVNFNESMRMMKIKCQE